MILAQFRHIYCIGIGGSGVSGIARMLQESGHTVSGSDEKSSSVTLKLVAEGIKITIGHKTENLPEMCDLVIYSPAIPEENPERLEAKKRKIVQFSYPQAVGLVTKNFQTISICGTHGKTTVTAMCAAAFIRAKENPTVILGSTTKELQNRNERLGQGKYFLLESCEYQRGFLNYHPKVIIITNLEIDHLDYYKDLEDYKNAFSEYIKKLQPNGLLIVNTDDENIRSITRDFRKCPVITFGTAKSADYRLEDGTIFHDGEILAELKLRIQGQHNLMNATAAVALCHELGIDIAEAIDALNDYRGASRRMEEKGIVAETVIIDDYAHHPTEITATLRAIREKYGKAKKILCIFQPHQYSRTRKLFNEFAHSFGDADEVIIPNILRARDSEEEVKSVSPEKLVDEISKFHPKASFGNGLENTSAKVKKLLPKFDVIVTMGAGDVWKIAEKLLKN